MATMATELDQPASLPAVTSGPMRPPRRPPYEGPPFQSRPQGPRRGGRSQHGAVRKGWCRRWRWLLVVPGLLGVLLGVSVVGAAVSPGNISFEAKWADW